MKKIILLLITILVISCKQEKQNTTTVEAQQFLDDYSKKFQKLYYDSAKAEWAANTHIVEGDTINAFNVKITGEAFAKFTGSKEVIEKTQELLKSKELLTQTQIRQLEGILYSAANNPEIVSELVSKRIEAENKQNETLFGFDFKVENNSISTGTIDSILRSSDKEEERLAYWNASKEVGISLKQGLDSLRTLRNQTVQALNYNDYFTYQISEYGISRGEMLVEMKKMVQQIWPLYRELHTWARYELAEKYNSEVPEYIPAHWLPNRWGQDWSSLVDVEGLDLDQVLKTKSPEWIVQEGENFYVSLGFDSLPKSFYTKSSMYPLPKGADYKKNNHASAWHMDLENDLRCLMSIDLTADYYETVHHELGHIYYFQSYTNKEVPLLLRSGANRAYHEAMGSLLGLSAMQQPFLENRGLIEKNITIDQTQSLLKNALNYIVFIPFSAGVMTEFENALYAEDLPVEEFNKKWWSLAKKYQGMVPPTKRGEEYCDAASKTHINNDAAQYYDYAISYILLFQLHDHISKNILNQDPHATDYYGNKKVGEFLHQIMKVGANCDWNQLLIETTGQELSAQPMLDYFEPLLPYLKEINKGRVYTLPENI